MSIENNLASIAASLATIAEVLKNEHHPSSCRPCRGSCSCRGSTCCRRPCPRHRTRLLPPRRRRTGSGCTCLPDHRPASLVAYVMASYKEMGPVKGNQIQGVLAALGITNINEATAAHYPAIYSGVEALKAQ